MNNTKVPTKVTIEGKEYTLNFDKAREIGLIEEVPLPLPLKPGDIYAAPDPAYCNNFLLIEAIWNQSENARKYQLLGMGCKPNSNGFYESLHTLEEIKEHLIHYKMTWKENINGKVWDLVSGR